MQLKNADATGFHGDRTSEGLKRILYSFTYWLIRLLFGLKIRDVNFSFVVAHDKVPDGLDRNSVIDAEMMIHGPPRCSSSDGD
jgi:hypothetical protein